MPSWPAGPCSSLAAPVTPSSAAHVLAVHKLWSSVHQLQLHMTACTISSGQALQQFCTVPFSFRACAQTAWSLHA